MKALVHLALAVLCVAYCLGRGLKPAQSAAVGGRPEVVLLNGKIITLDKNLSIKQAVAIQNGRFIAVGSDQEIRLSIWPTTRVVNLSGRTVIPGLNDSYIHATVAGLTWDTDMHWEFTRSLADGLAQIRTAAKERPAGSWIVVAGGWAPEQFAERRLPTRAELDATAPKHPVFLQYLGQAAVLNSAALSALGINRQTANPPSGEFERDPKTGELTGVLRGAAWKHGYDKIPLPPLDKIRESLRSSFRELNRLGLTSIGDVQTDGVNFAHRRVLADMARTGELTLRVNFYLAPNEPGDELEQLRRMTEEVKQLPSNDMFRFAGFGGSLIRRPNDIELTQKTSIDPALKEKYRSMIRFFAASGYNFQLRAARDDRARQLLDIIEEVHRETPFSRQRIAFTGLEDPTPETMERIKKLGGGISVQERLAFRSERSPEISDDSKVQRVPPLRTMIDAGVPLGAGSGGFRAANYSPMLSLWWLITGNTIPGTPGRDPRQNLSREEALRMYTMGSAWFTSDDWRRGSIEAGKLADLAVLDADYLTVPEDQIPKLQSLLTMVNGRIIYAAGPFAQYERR